MKTSFSLLDQRIDNHRESLMLFKRLSLIKTEGFGKWIEPTGGGESLSNELENETMECATDDYERTRLEDWSRLVLIQTPPTLERSQESIHILPQLETRVIICVQLPFKRQKKKLHEKEYTTLFFSLARIWKKRKIKTIKRVARGEMIQPGATRWRHSSTHR